MASKTKTITAFGARTATTSLHYGIGDGASANPGALFETVVIGDDSGATPQRTVWLETTDRDAGGAPLQSWTAAPSADFTTAQINAKKAELVARYNATLAALGYV
jgi:hypothetical protein